MCFHVLYKFGVVIADGFSCRKVNEGDLHLFRCSAFGNVGIVEDCRWPGTLIVRVEWVVLMSAAPSGISSYMPYNCFLFLDAASVFRASWFRGLCLAIGCSIVAEGSWNVLGTSLLSFLVLKFPPLGFLDFGVAVKILVVPPVSGGLVASRTSASLSRSSLYHRSNEDWLIRSWSPMMFHLNNISGCLTNLNHFYWDLRLPSLMQCLLFYNSRLRRGIF